MIFSVRRHAHNDSSLVGLIFNQLWYVSFVYAVMSMSYVIVDDFLGFVGIGCKLVVFE